MALDLTQLSTQVRRMSTNLVASASDTVERQMLTLGRYLEETGAEEDWARAVDLSRESSNWLLARPVEPFNFSRDLPKCPSDYALVATDGSQIDVDRHGMLACYLLNMGRVFLRYGSNPTAKLSSRPSLYYGEDDLYISDGAARRVAIEGTLLSTRRDVEEGVALAALADEFIDGSLPAVALQDGTLVRWSLANAEGFVQDYFLKPYLGYLDHLRERQIPVASYISRPRSPEVAGTIRLMFCPDIQLDAGRGAKCNECSDVKAGRKPSCSHCQGLSDSDILVDSLAEGQRGPIYLSMSTINIEMYGPHRIHFFYMRVGRELARVEIPQWVAEKPEWVDLIHALIYDQSMKGQGYPVALSRAHEQAIVRSADRRAFQSMVEATLLRSELPANASRKQDSKQRQAL